MAEPNELLRIYLGETVPEGGSDIDTMFTDEEIDTFLTSTGSSEEAAALGWNAKAASLSHLVDMAEGSSRRSLRQRWENAMAMAKYWSDRAGVVPLASKGTSIHDIERT